MSSLMTTGAAWWTLAVGAVAAVMLVEAPAAGGEATGTIAGRVTTNVARPAEPLRVTTDQHVCGETVPDESLVVASSGGVANAVVIATGTRIVGDGIRPLTIANRGCRFVPHVQIVRPGVAVQITSDDDTLHTAHAYTADDRRSLFNVAIPRPDVVVTRHFVRPGPVRLACDVHPWMRAWVVVTEEIAAMTDTDGRFRLEHVPSGSHAIRVWHERLVADARVVTVPAAGTATADFLLVEE